MTSACGSIFLTGPRRVMNDHDAEADEAKPKKKAPKKAAETVEAEPAAEEKPKARKAAPKK